MGLVPQVIKLDLEGGEPLALHGMLACLRAARAVVFEVNASRLASVGIRPARLIEWAKLAGNFPFVSLASDDRLSPLPLTELEGELQRLGWTNVVLTREPVLF
jgi:hypothetical protein